MNAKMGDAEYSATILRKMTETKILGNGFDDEQGQPSNSDPVDKDPMSASLCILHNENELIEITIASYVSNAKLGSGLDFSKWVLIDSSFLNCNIVVSSVEFYVLMPQEFGVS
ncbi:unnamed protein product [Dovyalis caffra]|uniref:Uncharacterized protein n=1 Tax=Dovyalis caffra TaxID=77055 RepID=A0AAV1RSN7_9ROSI|nr:unnamed protein product [Dovyalis caffra]